MKTPYDTALRVAERRLDRVRTAIARATEQVQRIDAEHEEAGAALVREGALAANDWRMANERYFVEARARRVKLAEERDFAQAQLEALRLKAVECYGERTALETAASRYREEAEHAAAAAEQAAMDDLVGGRTVRVRRSGGRRASDTPQP